MHSRRKLSWLLALAPLLTGLLGACGGNSVEGGSPIEGTRDTGNVSSSHTGTDYSLSIYLPPASAGPRSNLPVIYVLDGESWFDSLVDIVESTHTRLIIVGVHSSGQRSRDFVPANACTPNGGGHIAYSAFITRELIPYVERKFGGDPWQRALFGHSHGGSFVLYALFSESPGHHTFKAYLASDSSISCMSALATEWEQSYASAYRDLPIRLHMSYATLGNYTANLAYDTVIAQRNYGRLAFVGQAYSGSHGGIVPQALTDGIAFALVGAQ